MALSITNVNRTFTFETESGDSIDLKDVDQNLSPQDVMDHYAAHYPELTTAVVEGPIDTGTSMQYKFVTKLGTKG